jgi:hypothetical protein
LYKKIGEEQKPAMGSNSRREEEQEPFGSEVVKVFMEMEEETWRNGR